MLNFFKGLALGFSMAAPIGPIGLLCIRRSIAHGRLAGFVTGLGVATADAVYGAIAALGLGALINLLAAHRIGLQLGGGLVMLVLGLVTMRTKPPTEESRETAEWSLHGAYLSALAITATNPMTILSLVAIYTGLGLGGAGIAAAAWLVLGVFLGSGVWWWFLSTAASWFGARLSGGGLRTINIVAGISIAGFGVWQLAQLARG